MMYILRLLQKINYETLEPVELWYINFISK